VLAEWGGFLEGNKESQQALSLTQQAVFHAQEAMAPDLLYETQWRSGRLLRQAGNHSAALVAYREALEQLESIRQERMVVASSRNHSYRQEVGGVYMELVDLLLSSPEGNKKETLQEVQHILELLKSAELEDYFKDDCVDTARSRQQEQPIPPKVAVLYPIMLENRTVILLGRSDGWHQIVIPVAGEEVKQKAALLRFNLEKRTSRTYLNQARTLYDWLIRPLENHLQQVETLVFVPDETLREIPLATLHDGKQHLIDAYAVVVIPGLQLLQSQSLIRPSNHILLAGLTQGVQGFSPLPHVASELKAIATLYPGRTLQDDDFSLPNLHREMEKENYQVVHIASHGQFTGNIRESFLLTHDGRITMDDLDRLVRRPQSPDQPVDLLTLSACQTAKGDDRAALGLAGVAVKAGTRGALATLWYVNDQAASLLVEEFYRHLQQPGANKAVALQSAQKSLKQNRSYAHPAYWGGFLMIGNWL
ncbi:MAG: CHAT domain-containing protein, partial [Magnetococcales bacterium]|nr:CHAT domain-containing protein [Magnetococcales bacterium]